MYCFLVFKLCCPIGKMFLREIRAAFTQGEPTATESRHPTVTTIVVYAVCLCDHTTGCVRSTLFFLRQMDMGSLTCGQIWVRSVGYTHVYTHYGDIRHLNILGMVDNDKIINAINDCNYDMHTHEHKQNYACVH